jgi:phytoene dehydrogenase-like protein
MKTLLLVHVALLSLPIYVVGAALRAPVAGALAALVWLLGASVFVRGRRMLPAFEAALALAFVGLALAGLAGRALSAAQTQTILFGMLALGAAVSVAIGKPWTAEFAAHQYGALRVTPLFSRINARMSALWAAVFAWLALAHLAEWPALVRWAPLATAAVATVFLPKSMMRRGLEAQAAGDPRNRWTPPTFQAARFAQIVPAARASEGEAHPTARAVEAARRIEGTWHSTVTIPSAATCDVAVIGAGIGGLTAAALLADAGLHVQVFEQHNVPGGFAHNWLRRARGRDPVTGKPLVFRFDSGVHDVSGWYEGGTVQSVFERLGIADATAWRRLDHRYVIDGDTIDVPREWRAYVEQLVLRFPHEAAGIRALFDDIHAVFQAMYSHAWERGGIPGPPTTPSTLLDFATRYTLAVEWMGRSWRDFAARHVHDPQVTKWILALAGYVTDDPARLRVAELVPIFGYLFHGGHYPVGGSSRIATGLVDAIVARGGQVHLRTAVARILHERGCVTGVALREPDGTAREVKAQAVVSNADLTLLSERLLAGTSFGRQLRRQAGALRTSCSALGVYLGLRGALDVPPVIHIAGDRGRASLVVPSAVDASCAPPGYSTLEILALVRHDDARSWFPADVVTDPAQLAAYRRSTAYLERKRAEGDRLIEYARFAIPNLVERIVYRAESSPLTYQRYEWTDAGAIYGVTGSRATVPTRMPLRHLVVAGAATHGPGIEAVMISGAMAADALVPGVLRPQGKETTALASHRAPAVALA